MYNSYIGICKFIMSIMVIAIHVQPFTRNTGFYHNNCIARIADPAFFILSSYFLFNKLNTNKWDKNIFIKQIKHLFHYYFVWILIFSPVIISKTIKQTNSLFDFCYEIFKQIFLSGPYGALWFLPALILGVTLTHFLGKKFHPIICVIISFPFFLLSVLQMEYFYLIKDINWLTTINEFFVSIFGWLGNGINYAFFFCALGLYIASQRKKIRNIKFDSLMLIICFVLLVIECTIIRHFNLGQSYGAMFFLIPTSYYLIVMLLNLPNNDKLNKVAKHLQNMSLLIFPLHYGIMDALLLLFKDQSWYTKSTTVQYFMVITITLAISELILYLSKRYKFLTHLYGK